MIIAGGYGNHYYGPLDLVEKYNVVTGEFVIDRLSGELKEY